MTPAEHKKLLVRQQELKECIRLNRKAMQELDTKVAEFGEQLAKVEADLARPIDIVISEHAMLRYLERVQGMDMDELQQTIREEFRLESLSMKLGEYKLVQGDWRLIMKDNTLVTIEPAKRGK